MIRHLCRNQGDLFHLPDLYTSDCYTAMTVDCGLAGFASHVHLSFQTTGPFQDAWEDDVIMFTRFSIEITDHFNDVHNMLHMAFFTFVFASHVVHALVFLIRFPDPCTISSQVK
jgi:hypothetical protein